MKTFIFGTLWLCIVGASATGGMYGGGSGTPEDPYQIWTSDQLNELGQTTEDYDKNFILMADLDLASTIYERAVISPDNDPNTWGLQGTTFEGTLDGNGFVIHNLTIINPSGDYTGLMGRVGRKGTIRNLHLKEIHILGSSAVAGLVSEHLGMLSNCSVQGRIEGKYVAGGLVAFNDGGTIEGSKVFVLIVKNAKSQGTMGGVVGLCNRGMIRNCHAVSSIVLNQPGIKFGGFAGANWQGTLERCFSTSVINSGRQQVSSVGGFCGENKGVIQHCATLNTMVQITGNAAGGLVGNNFSTIASCYAEGKVVGKTNCGGLVGFNVGYIIDSYSDVAVSGQDRIGGFSGTNLYGIARSYTLGRVSAMDEAPGGFVGRNQGRIELSFWDIEASGVSVSAGGEPRTMAQMLNPETFTGWGDDRWVVDAGADRPRLNWEDTEGTLLQDEQAVYDGGTGTPEDPYLIASVEQLEVIGQYAQDLTKCYKLTTDLDFGGKEFSGIGAGKGFDGTFDGDGHWLSNITFVGNEKYTGLFPFIQKNGVIRNLHLQSVKAANPANLGAIAGKNEGLIENITADGIDFICSAKAHVCTVGALVGHNAGVMRSCLCRMKITVEGDSSHRFGGFVGSNNGTIEACGVWGSIESMGERSHFFGGFVGFCDYDSKIKNCFSAVDITSRGPNSRHFGGFVGGQAYRTHIDNSLAVGRIVAGQDNYEFGGFVGANGCVHNGGAWLKGCFWDTQISGIEIGIGKNNTTGSEPIGAATAVLQSPQIYLDAGWSLGQSDKAGVWDISDGNYPMLHAFTEKTDQ